MKPNPPVIKSKSYSIERDGGSFTLYALLIENDKVVSKVVLHHQDAMAYVLNKLQQAVILEHK